MQGTVKWFSLDKGYGFITSDDKQDHYFNVQGIQGSDLPSIGDIVEFNSARGHKGPRATSVVIIEKSRPSGKVRDDRVACPDCKKKVVPRLIVYRGEPERSVCPFCAAQISDFRSTSAFGRFLGAIGFLLLLFVLFNLMR